MTPVETRKTKTSRKAEESWSVDCSQDFQEVDPPLPNVDHSYALPASPAVPKTRLCEALARVESLEHELRNVKDRERRAKKTVRDLLEDLKGKNLINEDLKERLGFYSGKMKIIFFLLFLMGRAFTS
ncbi:THAP domain-containing protein 6-like [Carassius gibelio]|uniref:THAP domain-containing protein 6-like n=1 Tax=Carassius gibelio TaxID=101364 RepID=UPI0022784EFC|nr:THAP domain-containing protein 6-like [Carassius gibelio]